MLDFFRTATGSLNYVLMGGVVAWFASTWIIAANIHKHRTDTISAIAGRKRAEQSQQQEEHRRIAAEKRLAAAEVEIAKLRQKPLPERLMTVFNEIDPAIEAGLKTGIDVGFAGFVKQSQKDILDKLFAEPGSASYITPVEHGKSHGIGDGGPTTYVKFMISTNILNAK